MPTMNKRDQYGWLAIFLHWLLFLLVVGLVGSGKYSDSLPQGEKIGEVIAAHKQIGIAVFLLMALRFLWRLINRSVESLDGFIVTRFLAFCVHWALYLVILAQALGGVMMTQYGGREAFFLMWEVPLLFGEFGYWETPTRLLPEDPQAAAKLLREWHYYGGNVIIGLVALHFLGALFHHLNSKDTLRRMWFGYRPPYA